MEVVVDGETYKVNIIKKSNKNTYLRVKSDLEIYVTTNYLMPNSEIVKFITNNKSSVIDMVNRQKVKNKKNESFFYLGKEYDLVVCNTIKEIIFDEDKVYVNDKKKLNNFLKKEAVRIFSERLRYNYDKFEERIPYPELKIRNMKAKWGYCKKVGSVVMLNFNLIKYSVDEIDYVIVHELCHFIEFNHSKRFWYYVTKYKPDYRVNRKVLKEE